MVITERLIDVFLMILLGQQWGFMAQGNKLFKALDRQSIFLSWIKSLLVLRFFYNEKKRLYTILSFKQHKNASWHSQIRPCTTEGGNTITCELPTKHAFVRFRQAHILLSTGQDKPDHEDLHTICHESQPQHKVQGPLELPVTTFL